MPGLYKKHTATQLVMPEMRLEPLNVCLRGSSLISGITMMMMIFVINVFRRQGCPYLGQGHGPIVSSRHTQA